MWSAIFFASLALICAYAVGLGGAPERLTATVFAVAGIASILVPRPAVRAYVEVNWSIFSVDLTMLAGLLAIALLADRFWPMWVTALQIIVIAFHGVRGYDPTIIPYAYWFLIGKVAYPQMLLLAIGVARHRRRVHSDGREFAWTFQRWREQRPAG